MNNFIHPLAEVKSSRIGDGTRIWQFSIVSEGVTIGKDCNINCHTFIEQGVVIGDNVTVKSGVYLWTGILIRDNVFIGPNVTFTNDKFPRSKRRPNSYQKIVLEYNCSIGANSTILGGVKIGANSIVGAGSLVTKDVPNFAVVIGSPAKFAYWVDSNGDKLKYLGNELWSDKDGQLYEVVNNILNKRDDTVFRSKKN